jgi:perosamine synthetase
MSNNKLDADRCLAWPVIDSEAEAAMLRTIRAPNFVDYNVVDNLEREMASWLGAQFAVAQSSGTAALESALFAVGLRPGDEVIAPTFAYWACVQPAARFGATIVLVDVMRETLTIDPEQVASAIGEATRAVIAVHAHGRIADMERLRALCSSRGIAIVEDASHAVGSHCNGKRAGSLGEISIFSLNGKVFAAGEGGMLITNDVMLRDRALAWGLHHRFTSAISDSTLAPYAGIPIGGATYRISNLSAALARSQLAVIDQRVAEIDRAMKIFCTRLEMLPAVRVCRSEDPQVEMGAWHEPLAFIEGAKTEELDDMAGRLSAEGFPARRLRTIRRPLHSHPWFGPAAIDRTLAFLKPLVRMPQPAPVAESIDAIILPRFTSANHAVIDRCVRVFASALANQRRYSCAATTFP